MVIEKKSNRSKLWWGIFLVLIILHFIKLPFYYTEPGDALELSPFVEVEDGYHDEPGSLMLTTVRLTRSNAYLYAWSHLSPYREIIPAESVKSPDETDEEYFHRQQAVMDASQDFAKIIAYHHAGKDVNIEYRGILLTSFIEGMPAEELLEPEDRIITVNGIKVKTVQQLNELTANKGEGDEVILEVNRNGEILEITLPLMPFPEEFSGEDDRVGLGILYPIIDRIITYEPDAKIDVSKIGGPSAGLMFALELYNQLVPENITKGYHIAGTGEIDEEGNVGRIGGVRQKVVAAHQKGAEIFIVPNEGDRESSNYHIAQETAEELGISMKIVGVNTFEDAIQYLKDLEPKE